MTGTGSKAFGIVRLHFRSDDSWAVVRLRSGAIAVKDCGALLMRLSRSEAEAIAERMSADVVADDQNATKDPSRD
jgi:hypothetical protein